MPDSPQTRQMERQRTTIYLNEDDLISLDELRLHLRRTQRRKVDRSQLIREAIRAYHERCMSGAPPDGRNPQ